MWLTNADTVKFLLPELILVLLAAWVFVGSSFTRGRLGWGVFTLATLGVAACALWRQGASAVAGETPFAMVGVFGPLLADGLGYFVRWLALGLGFLVTLASLRNVRDDIAGETFGLILLLVAGCMIVAAAGELVLLFVGLELISIPTYALLFLGRRDRATGEATMKYFFLSILSSGLFLYGASFIYGITGSTSLADIQAALAQAALGEGQAANWTSLLPIAFVLVFAGLAFKVAAVPFHFYAPDVYQGVTNVNAGILAVAPKMAGMAALIRLVVLALPGIEPFGWQLVLAISLVTMTLGNVCALWQTNLRRMMAYSSIAHTGYMLMGLAVAMATAESNGLYGGIAATLFYVLVYAAASLGLFCVLASLSTNDRELSSVNELAGLARQQPAAAAALTIFLFSLAGIPPLAGFWGKFALFASAVRVALGADSAALGPWFTILAVAGGLNAAVGASYYLRVIAALYFQAPATATAPRETSGGGALAAGWICAAAVVLLGLVPGSVWTVSQEAEGSARQALLAPRPMPPAQLVQDPAARELAGQPAR